MMKNFLHDLSVEGPAFCNFIISSIIEEFRTSKIIAPYRINGLEVDAFMETGFPPYTKGPTIIEVKFASNIKFANDVKERIRKYTNLPICIIGAWEQTFESDNCIFIGKEIIKKFVKKYPELWWSFSSSYDENAQIKMSLDGQKIILVSNKLLYEFPCVLSVNEIDKISKVNEFEFLRLIKTSEQKVPAIIAGNGISIPYGSDRWEQLAGSIFDYLSPYFIDNPNYVKDVTGKSTYALTSLAKYTIPPSQFYSAIKNSIYRKYIKNSMHVESTLLHSIVKAKYKHPSMPLATYNYDSFLEDDFEAFYPKFSISSITNITEYIITIEPKIIHLHGYLPNKNIFHIPNLVLTDDEYFEAYRENYYFAPVIQSYLLNNYVCLFVGSSMSDVFQMSLIEKTFKNVLKKNNDFVHKTWKCFALMCLKNLSPKDKLTIINYYMRKGVFIIFADEYAKLPKALDKLMNF